MVYTKEEAIKASVDYFNGDELAADVFVKKYALRDGQIFYEKTPDDMHKRLTKEFARIEKKYPNAMSEDEIYNLLKGFKYVVPQGSPMSAIGNNYQLQSLGNCFVIESPMDSYGGIIKTDQELAQLMKRRAGVGFDISNIRPKGLPTNNAARTTDGIAVFMERFSNTCREVAQGGRRGAELMSISVHHPEIRTFINIKRDRTKVTGANISVRLSDEFLNAVKNNEEFELRWPVNSKNPKLSKKVDARELWDEIVFNAWENAEPGLMFWDNIIKNSPADIYAGIDGRFKTTSSNPCGEIVMGQDSCRLLLLNLKSFVKNPFRKDAFFDFDHFNECVIKAQRLMDDVIDLELETIDRILNKIKNDPEPMRIKQTEYNLWEDFKDTCQLGRRTGLGITALGDALAAIGIVYGSDDSINMTEKIYKALALGSHRSSCILAKERGAFPLHNHELEEASSCDYLKRIWEADPEIYKASKETGRRNIALTTTAPAGSVSCLTQTTSGIEPTFLVEYKRRRKIMSDENIEASFVDQSGDKWTEYSVYHHGFKEWMEITEKNDVKESPYYKATSNDVDWIQSVRIQSVAQKWISHSISKTCNIPNHATKELVDKIYMKAWEYNCKGFTVYRDGCRTGVLVGIVDNKEESNKNRIDYKSSPKRPEYLDCELHRYNINGEEWIFSVGLLDGDPFEIFVGKSDLIQIPKKFIKGKIRKRSYKSLGKYDLYLGEGDEELIIKDLVSVFDNPNHSAFTRLISLSMRHGAPIQYIVEQLQKDKDADLHSFSKIVGRILKKYISDGVKRNRVCSECGSNDQAYMEGCLTCLSCGASKCG